MLLSSAALQIPPKRVQFAVEGMKRTVYTVIAASSIIVVLVLRQVQQVAAFHPTSTNQYFSHSQQRYQLSSKPPQERNPSALRSTVERDNVMSAFDQAFAKLQPKAKASPSPADPTDSLEKMEISVAQSVSSTSTNTNVQSLAEKILKPRPPRTEPPKDAYRQQQVAFQQQQQEKESPVKRKNTVAVPASKRTFTTALVNGTASSPVGSATPLHANTNNGIAATVAPTREDASVETTQKQKSATSDRQVVSTIGGKMTVTKESQMYGIAQTVATWQSWCIGALVGTAAVTPVTLLHHFYFYPSYESFAQWEWDTGVALVQGAVFAAVYRYAIREDWNEEKLGKAVFTAFFLVRSLVGIDVPMSCSTPFLFCAEPLPFADWGMIQSFAMSAAESYVLFGAVAGTMDLLLRNSIIRPFK